MPVDATSTIALDGNNIPVTNAVDLAQALAGSPTVHACYMQHWIEFAFGRPLAPEDEAFTTRVGEESTSGSMPVVDLLVEIVKSNAFRNRATEELQ